MNNSNRQNQAFRALKQEMDSYITISVKTWQALRQSCNFKSLPKHHVLYASGTLPDSFAFVYSGLFRTYIIDSNGNEYNKNFFDKNSFPGCMAALLTGSPSQFTIESLEPSLIITIDFASYRRLLLQVDDLKLFQIYYLEKNWLLAKDAREVQIVQKNATKRYQRFLEDYASISSRIPQYHIASHLGITPTQLSRIRKNIG